jgi:lysophospholipase L1-like esterase
MKKILLIGDSIRIGYDDYVKKCMENLAEVYYPRDNCGLSTNILRYLHVWTDALKLYEADAVHFNVGLWDTLRIYGDKTIISPDTYRDNLRRIVGRIRLLFPSAKIIFATSTPVLEDEFVKGFEERSNADIEAFNEIACDVMAQEAVVINDLYELMKDVPTDYHSDQTHFYTAPATERLGMQVSRVLCEALELDHTQLTPPDKNAYHNAIRCQWDKDIYTKRGQIYVQK